MHRGFRLNIIQERDTESFWDNRSLAALKASKASAGNDCIWFENSMLEDTRKAQRIEETFSRAISEGEFVVYYQ